MDRKGMSAVSVIGVALVVLGVMFLLEKSGLFGPNASIVATYWPALLIVGGLLGLAGGGFRFRVWPLVLLVIGVIFLLSNMGLLWWDWGLLWPVALIFVGLVLLTRRFSPRRRKRNAVSASSPGSVVVEGMSGRGQSWSRNRSGGRTFQAGHIFSSGSEQVNSQEFRGGEVSAVFGSMELDLREAALADGGAVLETTVVFGSLELLIPPEWRVNIETTTTFGEAGMKRTQPTESETAGVLTVTGTVVFGSIEVKD